MGGRVKKITLPTTLQSFYSPTCIEAGVDEVGRGCLAGVVVAAAVVLPKTYTHPLLKDSKLLRANERVALAEDIKQTAISYAIAEASVTEIDAYNILNASILAMHRAIAQLEPTPEHLLIDGNRFKPYEMIPYRCIIKGDNTFFSIAAASVLAKTYRDSVMQALALQFPVYDWQNNVGYPTAKHKKAILQYGLTEWHRKSFKCT